MRVAMSSGIAALVLNRAAAFSRTPVARRSAVSPQCPSRVPCLQPSLTTYLRLIAGPNQTFATRQMATDGPMPYDDDKMPFYALGTNIGMQISSQTDFKNLLSEDELEILLSGFSDVVKGEGTANPMDVLQKYGPQVNELLRERVDGVMERVKKVRSTFGCHRCCCCSPLIAARTIGRQRIH